MSAAQGLAWVSVRAEQPPVGPQMGHRVVSQEPGTGDTYFVQVAGGLDAAAQFRAVLIGYDGAENLVVVHTIEMWFEFCGWSLVPEHVVTTFIEKATDRGFLRTPGVLHVRGEQPPVRPDLGFRVSRSDGAVHNLQTVSLDAAAQVFDVLRGYDALHGLALLHWIDRWDGATWQYPTAVQDERITAVLEQVSTAVHDPAHCRCTDCVPAATAPADPPEPAAEGGVDRSLSMVTTGEDRPPVLAHLVFRVQVHIGDQVVQVAGLAIAAQVAQMLQANDQVRGIHDGSYWVQRWDGACWEYLPDTEDDQVITVLEHLDDVVEAAETAHLTRLVEAASRWFDPDQGPAAGTGRSVERVCS